MKCTDQKKTKKALLPLLIKKQLQQLFQYLMQQHSVAEPSFSVVT